MARADPGLFPAPEKDIPTLSKRFGHGEYRAGPGQKVKWTPKKPRVHTDCEECSALQHETRGAYGPRRQIRTRRAVNGTGLDLCHAHALAWKGRDTHDGAE